MLRTKVKANSVTHLTDARYFAAREVTWLGFPLHPDTDNALARLKAIREWVDGVFICGEFQMADEDTILNAVADAELDAVQVDIFTAETVIQSLAGKTTIVQEITLSPDFDVTFVQNLLQNHLTTVDYFLLSGAKNGYTWQDIEQGNTPLPYPTLVSWIAHYPILLEFIPLPGDDGALLMERLPQLSGFALSGGAEEQVGLKNFDDLDAFLDTLEVA